MQRISGASMGPPLTAEKARMVPKTPEIRLRDRDTQLQHRKPRGPNRRKEINPTTGGNEEDTAIPLSGNVPQHGGPYWW